MLRRSGYFLELLIIKVIFLKQKSCSHANGLSAKSDFVIMQAVYIKALTQRFLNRGARFLLKGCSA